MTDENLYDVVAVNIETGAVRLLEERKTERNAEAIVSMAVMRRGLEEEFFAAVRHGTYHNGEEWVGETRAA